MATQTDTAERRIRVSITEQVGYSRTYTVAELECLTGKTLCELPTDEVMDLVDGDPSVEDDLQSKADVQGSVWTIRPVGGRHA